MRAFKEKKRVIEKRLFTLGFQAGIPDWSIAESFPFMLQERTDSECSYIQL